MCLYLERELHGESDEIIFRSLEVIKGYKYDISTGEPENQGGSGFFPVQRLMNRLTRNFPGGSGWKAAENMRKVSPILSSSAWPGEPGAHPW